MKNKIKNNNVTVNKEDKNMENNTQAPENAAPAADQNEAQNNVPTPPANEQAPTSEKKPKKKGLIKKILMIIGAIIALITGGFIAGRVTGNKSDDYIPDESGDDIQTTDF